MRPSCSGPEPQPAAFVKPGGRGTFAETVSGVRRTRSGPEDLRLPPHVPGDQEPKAQRCARDRGGPTTARPVAEGNAVAGGQEHQRDRADGLRRPYCVELVLYGCARRVGPRVAGLSSRLTRRMCTASWTPWRSATGDGARSWNGTLSLKPKSTFPGAIWQWHLPDVEIRVEHLTDPVRVLFDF